jgi:fused signal recognition particle receptor
MCAASMDLGGVQIDPQQVIEVAAVVAGLGVTGFLGLLLVRRARATRLRQIEGLGSDAPMPAAARRSAARPRPAEPEAEAEAEAEADDEAEAQADEAEADAQAEPEESEAKPEAAPPVGIAPRAPGRVISFPRPTPEVPKPARQPVPEVEKPRQPELPPSVAAPKAKRKDAAALAPGLARTRSGWVSRLGALFTGKREIDPALLDEVEKVLLTADIGVRTSSKLLEEMRASLSRRELSDPASAWAYLRRRSTELLSWDAPPVKWGGGQDGQGGQGGADGKPFVLLIIGVNGSGKTTTIGKLAAKLIADGRKVLVGAGDTFRAAAVEQLEIWANRVGATVVRGKEGADPSSVLFDAVKRARAEGFDVVIADTAGRLHTKTDLMEELQKVRRVIGKAAEGAPHETWLVIDSTNGQNAIAQAQIFTQAMSVSGIVLTKLDGTAKGGVILGIADQLRIPVRFIGVGERVEDLREFDAEEFVEALYQL